MSEFKISRIRYKWKGEWSSGSSYLTDDVVNYGGNVYVCLVGHTAESGAGFYNDLTSVVTNTTPPEPAPRWEKMMEGFQWTGDWTTSTPYNINDLAKDNGIVYRCITPHISALSAEQGIAPDLISWTIYASTDAWRADWEPSTKYKLNDIVRNGAIAYRCIVDHVSAVLADDGLEVNQANWQIVHSGVDYKSVWITATKYRVNDIVKWGARAWICITSHVATITFDETKWIVYAPGLEYDNQWNIATSYQIGDVVKYGGYSYFSKTFNIGMVPSTQLADWELLSIGYNLEGDYNNSTAYQVGDVVRRNGYLYACTADAQGVDPTNITYWEIVTTSFKWRNNWISGADYELSDIVIFQSNAYKCVTRHTASTPARPDLDISATYWIMYSQGNITNKLRSQGDINAYAIDEDGSTITSTRLPIGNLGELLTVNSTMLPSWQQFTEITKVYYVSVDGFDSITRGQTVDRPWRSIRFACQNVTGPATIFIKTGNYEETLPISIPANVALVGDELRGTSVSPLAGFEQVNMFYVRNGSGIRNMTLSGLSSSLGPLNVYLTRRPVASAAFVSLDPGTGPSDTSVHITTRSPYIQNVTTFGTACVGLKVDGGIHAAGNRSIVANDFTQVISDGIGAWVTNSGVSELVSVFSYYAHIGYLAENGGKVRATNGNSSYGTYGAVSEGVSLTETPVTGTVNNRSTEATVAAAFSGQAGDQIIILEYSHCGQDYTSANYTFTGAGTGASVSSVIRNNAVSEVRVKTRGDSSASGGGGYLTVSNNAQAGDTLTITLAANDPNTSVNYIGMRLIITSGTGTGQYGYIQAYDSGTKLATVYKESDGTAGWDHLSSFAIESVLDTTTVYVIEPRVIFSSPGLGGILATGRVTISSGRIGLVKIWNCGSGYISPPVITIVDPNNTSDVVLEARLANGVLGPVTWISRGNNYQTTSTQVIIAGDGFADKYQIGSTLVLSGVTSLPGPGDNLTITGINDIVYKIVTVTLLSGDDPNLNLRITLSPILEIEESPDHSTVISIRQNYSQVRLTGHDFLDIGTGGFSATNYPRLYADYNFVPAPENEVVESGGGRVFYTSTDQDGNFRVGELFKVEQATGTVTISAALFSLSGLEELSIGGVTVGGSSTVIREFSTDATFTADSNNIIPTQRAINAYIAARISGGGSDAFTSLLTAGVVRVGPNAISTTTGTAVNMNTKVNFNGTIDGTLLAFDFFKKSFI
jgi:hypothetical protein